MKHANYTVLLALHLFITTGQSQSIIPELKVCKGRSQSLHCMQPDVTSPGHENFKEISFYKTDSPDVLVAFWSFSPGHAVVTDQYKATWKVSKTSLGLALTVTPVDKDSVVGMYRCEISNSKITYAYIALTWDEICTTVDGLEAKVQRFSESLETSANEEGKPLVIAIVSLVFVILVSFVLIGGILYYFLKKGRKKKPPRFFSSCCQKKNTKGKSSSQESPMNSEEKENMISNEDVEMIFSSRVPTERPVTVSSPPEPHSTSMSADRPDAVKSQHGARPTTFHSNPLSPENVSNTQKRGGQQPDMSLASTPEGSTASMNTKPPGGQEGELSLQTASNESGAERTQNENPTEQGIEGKKKEDKKYWFQFWKKDKKKEQNEEKSNEHEEKSDERKSKIEN